MLKMKTYNCEKCEDTGWSIQDYIDGIIYNTPVYCDCPKGKRWKELGEERVEG